MRVSDRDEIWAITVLSNTFCEYRTLKKSEKPDFIDRDNSIGVEVTSAVNKEVMYNQSFYFNNLKNVEYEEDLGDSIKKIEKNGLKVTYFKDDQGRKYGKPVGLLRVFGEKEFSLLYETIQKKYSKKYEKLNKLDLYILFSQCCRAPINDNEFKKLLITAHECEKTFGKIFSNIFIDFSGDLVMLDLLTDEIIDVRYNADEIFKQFEKKVLEMENGKKEKSKKPEKL